MVRTLYLHRHETQALRTILLLGWEIILARSLVKFAPALAQLTAKSITKSPAYKRYFWAPNVAKYHIVLTGNRHWNSIINEHKMNEGAA